MAFDHLRLYRDIVQLRSLSRGAEQNGISQSAASQQLREAENRLGVTLLDRATRPFTVTPAGRLYEDFCRDVLRREEEFHASLDALRNEVAGAVRVASIYSVGLSDIAHLKEIFLERFPHATVTVDYLRPDKVYETILNDRADLGLVSYPVGSKVLNVVPWRDEEMVVAAAPEHPLANRRRVSAADLEGMDFVAFDHGLPIRREIDRFLREQSVHVTIAMQFDNIQMVKEAVALGFAISILPARSMRLEIEHQRLVAVPLDGHLVRPIGIVHRRKKPFNQVTQRFMDLLLGSVAEGAVSN